MITLQVAYPDEEGILRYRIFNKGVSRAITGNRAVIQQVTKTLLTDPGTDQFDPTLGGGLRKVIQKNQREVNPSVTQAELGTAISRTEDQILNSQPDLPLTEEEQLESVDVLLLEEQDDGNWKIDLKVNMADGNIKRVLLEA